MLWKAHYVCLDHAQILACGFGDGGPLTALASREPSRLVDGPAARQLDGASGVAPPLDDLHEPKNLCVQFVLATNQHL